MDPTRSVNVPTSELHQVQRISPPISPQLQPRFESESRSVLIASAAMREGCHSQMCHTRFPESRRCSSFHRWNGRVNNPMPTSQKKTHKKNTVRITEPWPSRYVRDLGTSTPPGKKAALPFRQFLTESFQNGRRFRRGSLTRRHQWIGLALHSAGRAGIKSQSWSP